MPWTYQPDEKPKRKHHWDNTFAGFVALGGRKVGKCPKNFDPVLATSLLNAGINFFPHRWVPKYPQRIYIVHQGVLYRASPTVPGISYHGYPETGQEYRRLPIDIRDKIISVATTKGCLPQLEKWLNQ
jgi:hypothetical protein